MTRAKTLPTLLLAGCCNEVGCAAELEIEILGWERFEVIAVVATQGGAEVLRCEVQHEEPVGDCRAEVQGNSLLVHGRDLERGRVTVEVTADGQRLHPSEHRTGAPSRPNGPTCPPACFSLTVAADLSE